MSNAHDYAILIGINKYKDPMFPELKSPGPDMQRFLNWLLDPAGGGLPGKNIRRLPAMDAALPEGSPQATDFHDQFAELIESHAPGNRLYLYLSGHGYSVKLENNQRTALYAANASKYAKYHIAGTDYANWTQSTGKFNEVVLVMDCCRDAEIVTPILPPPLPNLQDPENAANTKLLCIYGAPKGGKAQERPIPELSGQISSLLTHAFILALEHAPANQNGQISGVSIKNFIEDRWQAICGDYPADPPEIYLPPRGDIIFRRSRPKPLAHCFEISNWHRGSQIIVTDQHGQLVCQIRLQDQAEPAEIQWHDGSHSSVEVDNNHFYVPLPMGLYQAVLDKGQAPSVRLFQSGEDNVRF